MADIFLSYVREDRSRAEQLATALGRLGWDVWWDGKILPGRPFRDAISKELESAKCVVVLWSQTSVRSDYVRDEADEAKLRQVLVPVLIEQVKPPHGFRQHEAANLVAWNGDPADPQFELLRNGILSYVSPSQTIVSSTTRSLETPTPRANPVDALRHPADATPFETDVHISFANLDDRSMLEGERGWIAGLHQALEVRLSQLLGREARIWRDPKLEGNDIFTDRIVGRLQSVAVFVAVVSPRYVKSDWCRHELDEFVKASVASGGVRVGSDSRIFKVVKTPVSRELEPPAVQVLPGYEFFAVEPETGRLRELGPVSPSDAQGRRYWTRLDDLAHDIARLLDVLEGRWAEAGRGN